MHIMVSPTTGRKSVFRSRDYLIATAVVVGAVGVAYFVNQLMPHTSLSLLFLTGVLIVSAYAGLWPSIYASVLSFLAFNYFFTQPYLTLEVADDGDVATLVFFLIMAGITGNLAARMQQEVSRRKATLKRVSNQYDFSRRLSSAAGSAAVLEALADHVSKSIDRPVVLLMLDQEEKLSVQAHAGAPSAVPGEAAETAWTDVGEKPVQVGVWWFIKLISGDSPKGMLAVLGAMDSDRLDAARNLCDLAAIALERTQLVADLEQARIITETEQLRSALLSSVSHDLRTPLASIIGSTTSLLEYGDAFSKEDRKELLSTVVEEAQRLDRHIQNLLDMTRLGHGGMSLQRDWVDLHDLVSSAVSRLQVAIKAIPVAIHVNQDIPLLWVHGVLIEQALVNLLDNAVRFTPEDGRIVIEARYLKKQVLIDICDDGPGIPEPEREKIFDMFYTVKEGDRSHLQGTGLGLAICRGMVNAHGGSVSAHDGLAGRGTCMRILLPVAQPLSGETQ